jgi:hypothetical protein
MVDDAEKARTFAFKWLGCDASIGSDLLFRESIPESVRFFSDVHSTQLFYLQEPGSGPSKEGSPRTAAELAEDESIRWEKALLARGYLKPIPTEAKRCRVIEVNGTEELWLYMLKCKKDDIRYAISNAPEKTKMSDLQWAACLRWQMKKCYEECSNHLGLNDYASRSYVTWHRHMLIVMMASLFLMETRMGLK